jgi:hypothetical protein
MSILASVWEGKHTQENRQKQKRKVGVSFFLNVQKKRKEKEDACGLGPFESCSPHINQDVNKVGTRSHRSKKPWGV